MKNLSIIFFCTVFLGQVAAQIKVEQIKSFPKEIDSKKGFFYYKLPKVTPILNIELEKTEYKISPCNCLDAFHTNINKNVKSITDGKTDYVIKSVKISAVSEPDNDKIFMVKISPNAFKDLGWDFVFDKNNLLTSGETQSEDKTADFVVESLKSLGSIIGSVAFPKGLVGPGLQNCDQFIKDYKLMDATILKLISDGATIATKSTNSVEEIKYRINELEKIKIALFYKYVYSVEKTTTLYKIPLEINCNTVFTNNIVQVIFGNSNTQNISISEAYLNNRYKNILYTNSVPLDNSYIVEFKKIDPVILPYHSSDNCSNKTVHVKNGKTTHGIVYNIPQAINVSIKKYDGTNGPYIIQQDTIIMLPQLGTMGTLSQNLSKTKFELIKETGEVFKISGTSKALLSKDHASGVGSAISTTADKIRSNYDELLLLERERKLLEEQQKIEALKLELGL